MTDIRDISDLDGIAKRLVDMGSPVTPILKQAGITSMSTDLFGGMEEMVEDHLRTIGRLCAIVERLTSLHSELLQFAPNSVRSHHQHTVRAMLTALDDRITLSSTKV